MTRSTRLGLCQWTLDDDVDLSEINENFRILDGAVANFAAGTYSGDGGCGSEEYNQLVFSFLPRLLLIFSGSRQCVLYPACGHGFSTAGDAVTITASLSDYTVRWYADTADAQMNIATKAYVYVALG